MVITRDGGGGGSVVGVGVSFVVASAGYVIFSREVVVLEERLVTEIILVV